jgi:lipopolysaccharide export system ATP-binding protein
MNVRDNIKAILEIKNSDKEEIDHKATELLNEFSISHLENKIASTLSGGERRRLEIARTLASNPRFILLDEPLAGIDPIAVNDIKYLVSHLKERNIGILVTDHNVRETLDMVDRTYVIYDGKILMAGTPEEIINSAKVRELYLGNNFDRI